MTTDTRQLAPLNVPALLKAHGLSPKKGLGQNFLVSQGALEKIVACAGITPDKTVLEIGPGLGSLTRLLALAARQVVAVELDGELIPILREVLMPFPNVTLRHGDILDFAPGELVDEAGYDVVANIPYFITSALIRHLLEAQHKPECLMLTVQREVAERICAAPGNLSLLALSVQVYGQPQVALHIPSGAFYPPPRVDSAAVRVALYPRPLIAPARLETFFRLIKAGFSQKRKTLRNSLSAGLHLQPTQAEGLLAAAGIDPRRRAETVSIEEWGSMVAAFQEEDSPVEGFSQRPGRLF